jgi:hypothetical protein
MRRYFNSAAALLLSTAASSAAEIPEKSSLAFLPPDFLSSAEAQLVLEHTTLLRNRLLVSTTYSRHGGSHRSIDRPMGGILVLPPDQRRVSVTDGFRAHLDAASALPFPLDSRLRASSLSSELQLAVSFTVNQGESITSTRRAAIAATSASADALRGISRRIATLMPPTVRHISGHVNTAFMGALIDALNWLDVDLVQRFVYGFPIVGIIPDSGVYRPIAPKEPAEASANQLRYFHDTAASYNAALLRRTRYRQWSIPADQEADAAVATQTKKELSKAVVFGPFTSISKLHDNLAHRHPHLQHSEVYPRAMPRFGVAQKGKLRAIDDAKSNGANAATVMAETVTTPSFVFPGVVARAASVVASAYGLDMPPMTIALADLSMAYRTSPTSQPWFTTFCFFNPSSTRAEFYYLPGHNFGLVSAVVNFNRYPELVVVAARAIAAVPAEHYYDDFIIADVKAGGSTGLDTIEALMLALANGTPRPAVDRVRAPELDPLKTQETAAINTVLGVIADLSDVHSSGVARFSVSQSRVQTVLAAFRGAFQAGIMSPHLASSIRGKLHFLISAAYAAVGRAATLPLVTRQYRDVSHTFSHGSELHHSLLFFEALLPRLPPSPYSSS